MPDPLDPPDPPKRPKATNGSAWPAWLIAYAATLFVLRDVILTLFK